MNIFDKTTWHASCLVKLLWFFFAGTDRLSPHFKKQTPAVKTADMKYLWQFLAQCYCVVSKLRLNTTSFLTVQCSRVSVVRPGTHNPCLVRVILILAGEYCHDCTTQSNRTDFFAVCRYMQSSGRNRLDFYDRSLEITSDQWSIINRLK